MHNALHALLGMPQPGADGASRAFAACEVSNRQLGAGESGRQGGLPDLVACTLPQAQKHTASRTGTILEMCLQEVKDGGDYMAIAAEYGLARRSTEFEALHRQALASAQEAIRNGRTCMDAATMFNLAGDPHQVHSLMMFAAREIGVPRVIAGERFLRVRDDLGIASNGMAVQVLVEAMPESW